MTFSETISLSTKGSSDILDITHHVDAVIDRSSIENGLVTVFCPGSTGSVTTIEYESGMVRDLQKAIEKIVPSNIPSAPRYPRNARCAACCAREDSLRPPRWSCEEALDERTRQR